MNSRLLTFQNILYFTKIYGDKSFGFGEGGTDIFEKRFHCPVSDCYATSDRNYLPDINDFDAITFHGKEIKRDKNGELLIPDQTKRKPHQRYVFYSKESPVYMPRNYMAIKG